MSTSSVLSPAQQQPQIQQAILAGGPQLQHEQQQHAQSAHNTAPMQDQVGSSCCSWRCFVGALCSAVGALLLLHPRVLSRVVCRLALSCLCAACHIGCSYRCLLASWTHSLPTPRIQPPAAPPPCLLSQPPHIFAPVVVAAACVCHTVLPCLDALQQIPHHTCYYGCPCAEWTGTGPLLCCLTLSIAFCALVVYYLQAPLQHSNVRTGMQRNKQTIKEAHIAVCVSRRVWSVYQPAPLYLDC